MNVNVDHLAIAALLAGLAIALPVLVDGALRWRDAYRQLRKRLER